MRTLPFIVLVVLTSASSAHAWQVFFQVTSEVSLRGSSETSTAASRADQAERAQKMGPQGSQCSTDADCVGFCDIGTCVDPVLAQPTAPDPRMLDCIDDQSCAIGYACRDRRCVEQSSSEPPLLQPAVIQQCTGDVQCVQGQSCVNGQCLSPPPSPPSSSLQRRGSELYLRERAVQLRQDLALGEGPVISTLAMGLKVSALKLGRTMRAHREELAALIGDGADTQWPRRFLGQLDALNSRYVTVASR